jgi:D-3-phosphoglycerate dehydrogenase
MRVLLTDTDQPDVNLARTILEKAGFDVTVAQCRTPAEVIAAGQEIQAFLVEGAPVTREVFTALPDLRMISCCGVGVDTVDLEAARERGVWVANVPDANTGEVATHALGMVLSLIRHLPFYDRAVRAGQWHYEDTGPLRRAGTMTLGIAGLGRIGRLLAHVARPCFGHFLAYDPYVTNSAWPDDVERVELTDLFRRSDVVSLHMPLTEETRELVNSRLLSCMPPGSYLVNVGRGALVNIEDLLQALDSNQLAGAALDVLPQEPPPPDHPLVHHPRTLLTPHSAFYSLEGERELRRKQALNVVTWAREGRPPYVVVAGR